MNLQLLPQTFSICRLSPEASLQGSFFSVTRTADELSVVCFSGEEPVGSKVEADWRALKVAGPLDFALTGILYQLLGPLAEAKISIFALSTFDTDYILIRSADIDRAIEVLRGDGHDVARETPALGSR